LNLELIETALGQKLSNIKLFASPDLALENFTAATFDVVITDYRLPGQNGAELAKIMRVIDPNCSFYLMTAAISDEEARELLVNTFEDVLEKPFELSALIQLLKEEQLARFPEQLINTTSIFDFLEGN